MSQNSDKAQTGPGVSPPKSPRSESAPSPKMGPNGSSQGSSRGKDGK